jgi:hypothetical protein
VEREKEEERGERREGGRERRERGKREERGGGRERRERQIAIAI